MSTIGKYFDGQVTPGPAPFPPMITMVIWITVEVARRMLDGHVNFRKEKKNITRRYVDLMERDKWIWNSPPLIFDGNGNLTDGQHRLRAVIATGIPQWFNCAIANIDKRSLDVGGGRTNADFVADANNKGDVSLETAATNAATAIKSIRNGPQSTRLIPSVDLVELYVKFEPAIKMLDRAGFFDKEKMKFAQIKEYTRGAFGRAWIYHANRHEEIENAARALACGLFQSDVDPIYRLAMAMRKGTIDGIEKTIKKDGVVKREWKRSNPTGYLKTANAIKRLLHNETADLLRIPNSDPFPIEKLGY